MSNKELFQEDFDTLTADSPSYTLVLWNDDVNTFDWVIKALVDICSMDELQAEQCSMLVHLKGKCTVAEGEYKTLKTKHTAITDRGIQATIEELASY